MDTDSPAEDRFRERVKQERFRRGWSQADLAKRLQRKGLEKIYPTTVAKIEAGDREVKVGEAAVLADLFDLTVDALLGLSAPKTNARLVARALLDAVEQASWQVESIEATVRDRLADFAAVPGPKGFALSFPAACAAACDRLADAGNALNAALNPPEAKGFKRVVRKMRLDELLEEERNDETKS